MAGTTNVYRIVVGLVLAAFVLAATVMAMSWAAAAASDQPATGAVIAAAGPDGPPWGSESDPDGDPDDGPPWG